MFSSSVEPLYARHCGESVLQCPHQLLDMRVAMAGERERMINFKIIYSQTFSLLPWKADFPCCRKGVAT